MNTMTTWLRTNAPVRDGREGVTGVSAGIAHRLGVAPGMIRLAFVLASLLLGAGAVIYLVAWLLMPTTTGQVALDEAVHGRSWWAAAVLGVVIVALVTQPHHVVALLVVGALVALAVTVGRRHAPTTPQDS